MTAPALLPKSARRPNARPRRFPPAELLAERDLPPHGAAMTYDEYAATRFHGLEAEWVGGRVAYKPMTSDLHGAIVTFLLLAVAKWADRSGATPSIRSESQGVRVIPGIREPDVAVLRDHRDPRRRGPYEWGGADLVIEVISPDDPDRDLVSKRAEYEAADVGEYWIVDPRPATARNPAGRTVRVLTRDPAGDWSEATFAEGDAAAGAALPGFAVAVTDCLNAV